jgi:agmatinase
LRDLICADSRFLGSMESMAEADVVLIGVPFDGTVSFQPGARFAPVCIRHVSHSLEDYSPRLDKSLSDVAFYDAGDLEIPPGDTVSALSRVHTVIRQEVLGRGKRPFVLGGEHLVSLPVIEAVHEYYPDLAVVHFDAHADLRDEYLGVKYSHATVMRRVCERIGADNVYQFGIRSGSKQELDYARQHVRCNLDRVTDPLRRVLPRLGQRPVYVTLDIDVIDPGYAPGTGTPEPCGCTPHELMQALYEMASVKVVGIDLVEVCPPAETGLTTSILAAKLVREALLSFGSKV